jgi:hypothetical protein
MKEAIKAIVADMRRSITMNQSIIPTANHFSACATLVAIGAKLKQVDFFGPIRTQAQIKQKTVKTRLLTS